MKTKHTQERKQKDNEFMSKEDVFGSYTGTPLDGGQPQQDADDL